MRANPLLEITNKRFKGPLETKVVFLSLFTFLFLSFFLGNKDFSRNTFKLFS